MTHRYQPRLTLAPLAILVYTSTAAAEPVFNQANLVSDGAVPAAFTDPNLVNPWGVAFNGQSPFWVSDNGTGVSTLYAVNGQPNPLVVTIPNPGGGTAAPTGQVFNATTGFTVSANGRTQPSSFIFATEDGTISGWNPNVDGTHAVLAVDRSAQGAVYKGLARIGDRLYAADFANGRVDIFNNQFQRVSSFTDPNVPSGFAPFNVAVSGNNLYVTFALRQPGSTDDQAGPGNGFVDVFDASGTLQRRLVSNGPLNSPWGITIAPTDFGDLSNSLLIGNFGDGRINAFDPQSGQFLATLLMSTGEPLDINGLWSLIVRDNRLFFSAGINDEADGLFGRIDPVSAPNPVPEPRTWALLLSGLALVGLIFRPNLLRFPFM